MKSDTLEFIRSCIAEGKIFWTYHVNMRLQGRYITREHILAAVDTFEIIEDYPDDKYLPSCLVWAKAIEGIIHIHMALDREGNNVRIVTAYRPGADKWTTDFKRRRKK
jgi:hypothetical protein